MEIYKGVEKMGTIQKGQKKAYIMIGIQGSGKSIFCSRFLADVERINLDTLHTRNREA